MGTGKPRIIVIIIGYIRIVLEYEIGTQLEPLNTESLLRDICAQQNSGLFSEGSFRLRVGNRDLTPENRLLEQLKMFLAHLSKASVDDRNREQIISELKLIIKYTDDLSQVTTFREADNLSKTLMRLRFHFDSALSQRNKEQKTYECRRLIGELGSEALNLKNRLYNYLCIGIEEIPMRDAYDIENSLSGSGFCHDLAEELRAAIKEGKDSVGSQHFEVKSEPTLTLENLDAELRKGLSHVGEACLRFHYIHNICAKGKELGGSMNVALKQMLTVYYPCLERPISEISTALKKHLENIEKIHTAQQKKWGSLRRKEEKNRDCCCGRTTRFYELKQSEERISFLSTKRNMMRIIYIYEALKRCEAHLNKLRMIITDPDINKELKDTVDSARSMEADFSRLNPGMQIPRLDSTASIIAATSPYRLQDMVPSRSSRVVSLTTRAVKDEKDDSPNIGSSSRFPFSSFSSLERSSLSSSAPDNREESSSSQGIRQRAVLLNESSR